jgi:hypothetical protein
MALTPEHSADLGLAKMIITAFKCMSILIPAFKRLSILIPSIDGNQGLSTQ